MTGYETTSFLPYLNNELGSDEAKAANKARFSALNAVMLTMFSQDTMVYPKQSEWFWQLEKDLTTVQPLEESQFYQDDLIGLKTLNEAGKVTFNEVQGNHLQFSQSDIDDIFVPFLLS